MGCPRDAWKAPTFPPSPEGITPRRHSHPPPPAKSRRGGHRGAEETTRLPAPGLPAASSRLCPHTPPAPFPHSLFTADAVSAGAYVPRSGESADVVMITSRASRHVLHTADLCGPAHSGSLSGMRCVEGSRVLLAPTLGSLWSSERIPPTVACVLLRGGSTWCW
jgi:hypothetical protein